MTARFAGGPDFVSDAIDPLAASIQAALETRTSLGPAVEFGACALGEGGSWLIYLRIADADGDFFTHAVTCPRRQGMPPAYRIERAFAEKYGEPVGPRARELMTRLAEVTVSQAMLTLTDVFLDEPCLAALDQDAETTSAGVPSVEAGRRQKEPARISDRTLPWFIATASVGIAGYLAGQLYPIGLPPVSSSPPALSAGLEMPERENAEQLGPAEMPLSSQIEFERRGHAEELTALRAEVDRLSQQLRAGEPAIPAAAGFSTAADSPSSGALGSAVPAVHEPASAEGADAIATVDADILWVRAGPGSEHARLVRLERDVSVELVGSPEGAWSQIAQPTEGWVATRFLAMPTR